MSQRMRPFWSLNFTAMEDQTNITICVSEFKLTDWHCRLSDDVKDLEFFAQRVSQVSEIVIRFGAHLK